MTRLRQLANAVCNVILQGGDPNVAYVSKPIWLELKDELCQLVTAAEANEAIREDTLVLRMFNHRIECQWDLYVPDEKLVLMHRRSETDFTLYWTMPESERDVAIPLVKPPVDTEGVGPVDGNE